MRVSRRIGSLALGRFIFGVALLGVMWLLWSANYAHLDFTSGDAAEIQQLLSRFATQFSMTFFMVQLVMVLLLTPIYVAGSIFEERETRSGEVLLTTDLTRREIFYGKFLARVMQVILVVTAGMPILALTLLWGGVSVEFILIGYAVTLVSIFSAGSIAASVSSGAETLRGAILMTYAYIVFFDGILFFGSPFLVLLLTQESPFSGLACGGLFLVIRLIVISLSLNYGLRWLRMAMLRQRKRVTGMLAEEVRHRQPIMPDEDAFWWKEKNVATNAWLMRDLAPWIAVAILLPVMLGVAASVDVSAGWVAVYALPLGIIGIAGIVGVSTASSVAMERQKNTLIDLFMVPGARRAILRAKFWGALWRARYLLGLLVLLSALSTGNGTPVVALPFMLVYCTIFLLFAASFGLWLSVYCQTAWNANVAWVGTVTLGLIGGIILVEALSPWVPNPTGPAFGAPFVRETPSWALVVHPYYCWHALTMTELETGGTAMAKTTVHSFRLLPNAWLQLPAALAGLLLLAVTAYGFWIWAVRRFEREGRV
jgi:ABC-type transport system involved in multi-copper enzyme maturation permease subunit